MKEFSNQKSLLLLILALFVWLPSLAQSSRTDLEKALELTENLLDETRDQEKKAQSELNLMNRQIRLREQLVGEINREIQDQRDYIDNLDGIICQPEEDMEQLILNYGRMAQMTYASFYADNFWLAILSSASLTEAYYRTVYFRQFSEYRRRQIQLIKQTRNYLEEKKSLLQESILKNRELITTKSKEVSKLQSSRQKQQEVFQDLQSQSLSYQKSLLQRKEKLKSVIRKEQETYLNAPGNVDQSYDENFPRRQGLLPWPVPPSKGLVVGKFGKTEDPFGNPITNDGIYIRTSAGEKVKAIYSGKVSAVSKIPLSGSIVILEHGSYRTVYSNLSSVNVKKGDLVSANQILGKVRTDPRTQETLLQFMLYTVPDKFLDPEIWLIEP